MQNPRLPGTGKKANIIKEGQRDEVRRKRTRYGENRGRSQSKELGRGPSEIVSTF